MNEADYRIDQVQRQRESCAHCQIDQKAGNDVIDSLRDMVNITAKHIDNVNIEILIPFSFPYI
jgi:hypothetical protein